MIYFLFEFLKKIYIAMEMITIDLFEMIRIDLLKNLRYYIHTENIRVLLLIPQDRKETNLSLLNFLFYFQNN